MEQILQPNSPTCQWSVLSPAHLSLPKTDEPQPGCQDSARRHRRPCRQTKSFDLPRSKWTASDSHQPKEAPDHLARSSRRKMRPARSFNVDFLKAQPQDTTSSRFQSELTDLTCSQQEVLSILQDDAAFQTLKTSLRQRGCVTNGYLKENFHFYVQHVKAVRAARQQEHPRTEASTNLQDLVRHAINAAA